MALAQTDPKRMLAYSSIAQVGYIGVGLGTGNPLALAAAVSHHEPRRDEELSLPGDG